LAGWTRAVNPRPKTKALPELQSSLISRPAGFRPEELDHDFLWRAHKATPGKGMIGLWNRSHYEDVLIVRVHKLVPKKVWKARYDEINRSKKFYRKTAQPT